MIARLHAIRANPIVLAIRCPRHPVIAVSHVVVAGFIGYLLIGSFSDGLLAGMLVVVDRFTRLLGDEKPVRQEEALETP